MTLSGSITGTFWSDAGCSICDTDAVHSFNGSCTWTRPACALFSNGNDTIVIHDPCSVFYSSSDNAVCSADPGISNVNEVVVSKTVKNYVGQGCDGTGYSATGTSTETLSWEYTTAILSTDVSGALSSATWGSYGASCPDSVFTQSADELTISKREVDLKVQFSAVPAGWSISWDIYSRVTGYVTTLCVDLSPGDTEYVIDNLPPTSPNDAYYIVNIVLVGASC